MNQPTDLDAVLESIAGQRIAAVPASARAVHRTILSAFAETGDAPTRARLGDDLALETLAANDLIGVGDTGEIVYAYPFSARRPPTASGSPAASSRTRCAPSTPSASRRCWTPTP